MKTKLIITTVLSLVVLIQVNLIQAQSDYLKITRSSNENDFIKYPPSTTFQLKDKNNKVIFSDTSSQKVFQINKPYTLIVNPPYKDESNTYKLYEGKLEIKSNKTYYAALEKSKEKSKKKTKLQPKTTEKKNKADGPYKYDKNHFTKGLAMNKTLEVSTINPETYNATFTFNNGVIATYMDGEMVATQNNKSLTVRGNYVIYTTDGEIKLSFRPKTGQSWWYFEANEDN